MRCLRIHATPDGESHFDQVELPTTRRSLHPKAAPFEVTASDPASRVRITRIPAGMREVARHTVPEPNLTVRLDGSVEHETSDGEVRHVRAGSFVLVPDTHGKGHLSRHSPEARTVIWISPPNGLDLPIAWPIRHTPPGSPPGAAIHRSGRPCLAPPRIGPAWWRATGGRHDQASARALDGGVRAAAARAGGLPAAPDRHRVDGRPPQPAGGRAGGR